MKKIFGSFSLSGEKAKFTSLKKAFGKTFEIRNEVGSVSVAEDYKTLDILLNMLIVNYQNLQKSKIDKIVIMINLSYTYQCNWEVSPEQLNKLNFLHATLCVTAYKDE